MTRYVEGMRVYLISMAGHAHTGRIVTRQCRKHVHLATQWSHQALPSKGEAQGYTTLSRAWREAVWDAMWRYWTCPRSGDKSEFLDADILLGRLVKLMRLRRKLQKHHLWK